MSQTVLEMAKDLVMMQVQTSKLPLEDMYKILQKTYANLMELKVQEDAREGVGKEENGTRGTSSAWKNSIKKSSIVCLICGAAFKQLSIRHLKNHGLNARSYRVKYGIPRKQPLSAKDTTAIRKQIVQQSRPWEKAPRYLQAHAASLPPQITPNKSRAAQARVETKVAS
jgi:predicted transcriptional regulator